MQSWARRAAPHLLGIKQDLCLFAFKLNHVQNLELGRAVGKDLHCQGGCEQSCTCMSPQRQSPADLLPVLPRVQHRRYWVAIQGNLLQLAHVCQGSELLQRHNAVVAYKETLENRGPVTVRPLYRQIAPCQAARARESVLFCLRGS